MSHIHEVIDTDVHYKIDGVSRTIANIDETKRMLVQHDHNSERLTFEIPRFVDGHDFSECNVVEVHYRNEDKYGKEYSIGVYPVTDLGVKQGNEEMVILTWLVSGNATKYVGTLNFIIRFSCVTDNHVDYSWNTTLFSGISILEGLFNSEQLVEFYPDIIAEMQSIIKDIRENPVSNEKIEETVNNFLLANPVQPGATAEEAEQIWKNRDDIIEINREIGDVELLLSGL